MLSICSVMIEGGLGGGHTSLSYWAEVGGLWLIVTKASVVSQRCMAWSAMVAVF